MNKEINTTLAKVAKKQIKTKEKNLDRAVKIHFAILQLKYSFPKADEKQRKALEKVITELSSVKAELVDKDWTSFDFHKNNYLCA